MRRLGLFWVYPKALSYEQVLAQEIRVNGNSWVVPLSEGGLFPLSALLSPSWSDIDSGFWSSSNMIAGRPPVRDWNYCVRIPEGIHSAREIINSCCLGNPNVSFQILLYDRARTKIDFNPISLDNGNPLLPPRAAAVKFWELEIGKPTNGIPSLEEVASALGDASSPQKRWAAQAYLQLAWRNYNHVDLYKNKSDPKAAWAALAILRQMDPWIQIKPSATLGDLSPFLPMTLVSTCWLACNWRQTRRIRKTWTRWLLGLRVLKCRLLSLRRIVLPHNPSS